jgi:hypothetical protein
MTLPAPPHALPGAQAPTFATDIPCDEAVRSFQYVTPSQPHTGALSPASTPRGWQVPVLQSGASQYWPVGHAFACVKLHDPVVPLDVLDVLDVLEPPVPVVLLLVVPPVPVDEELAVLEDVDEELELLEDVDEELEAPLPELPELLEHPGWAASTVARIAVTAGNTGLIRFIDGSSFQKREEMGRCDTDRGRAGTRRAASGNFGQAARAGAGHGPYAATGSLSTKALVLPSGA